MKNIVIFLLILIMLMPSVGYATEQSPSEIPQASQVTTQDVDVSSTEVPKDNGFKLEWYHYAVAAAIIFGMCIYTMSTVKPATK